MNPDDANIQLDCGCMIILKGKDLVDFVVCNEHNNEAAIDTMLLFMHRCAVEAGFTGVNLQA